MHVRKLTHNYSQQHGSIVTKKQKQLKNPSPGERPTKMWRSKQWEIIQPHGNEVLTHTTTRMKTRLHERTWSQKDRTACDPTYMKPQNRQFSRDQKPASACLGLRGRWKEEGATDRYWEYSKISSC